jgi:puromycin-sensitive aminopeptidase
MTARLATALRTAALSAVDRAALLLDSYALAKAGLQSPESAVEVLRALGSSETSSTVWEAMAGVMNGLAQLMDQLGTTNAAAYEKFRAFGKTIVVAALARVGWEPRDSDTHTDKLARSAVLSLLDTFAADDESVLAEARRRFDGHFENPALLPSEYKVSVVFLFFSLCGGLGETKTP